MIAGYVNDKSDLHLENEVIKYSPSFKYLGATLLDVSADVREQ